METARTRTKRPPLSISENYKTLCEFRHTGGKKQPAPSTKRLLKKTAMYSPVTIVNVGFRHTNYWVIGAGRSRLLVDVGYHGGFGELRANLQRMDVPLAEIRYALATHYHLDHAGAAQDLKNAGVPLLVIDLQLSAIPLMKRNVKPHDEYTEIALHDNVVIPAGQSRELLARRAGGRNLAHAGTLLRLGVAALGRRFGIHWRPDSPSHVWRGRCVGGGRRKLADGARPQRHARVSRPRAGAGDGIVCFAAA